MSTQQTTIRLPVELRQRLDALAITPYGGGNRSAVLLAALRIGLDAMEAERAAKPAEVML